MANQEELADDNDNRGITSIITSNEMLKVGVKLGGYKNHRINREQKKQRTSRGSSPFMVQLLVLSH